MITEHKSRFQQLSLKTRQAVLCWAAESFEQLGHDNVNPGTSKTDRHHGHSCGCRKGSSETIRAVWRGRSPHWRQALRSEAPKSKR